MDYTTTIEFLDDRKFTMSLATADSLTERDGCGIADYKKNIEMDQLRASMVAQSGVTDSSHKSLQSITLHTYC